ATNTFTAKEIAELQEKFNEFDSNNDGRVDTSELKALTVALKEPATDEDIAFVLESFDDNNDGGLDFGEFVNLMKNLRAISNE
ncbi:hypothetical protein BGZ46_010833, partial [Entomortierella lignicola]